MSILSKLQSLLTAANTKTGQSDTTLTDAMQTLVDGYGQGGGTDLADFCANTMTTLDDDSITSLMEYCARRRTNITKVFLSNCTRIDDFAFYNCTGILTIVLPSINYLKYDSLANISHVTAVDLGPSFSAIARTTFNNDAALKTLVLRSPNVVTLDNVNAFQATPFASGGSGGTIYVPGALIDSYKAATNWITIDGYETVTWTAIEGSIYETQYADGTPIN